MTRFIFITDTHIGARDQGYHQQPRYTDFLPLLMQNLKAWIRSDSRIDFVLHGGDIVDAVSIETIKAACSIFDLQVPLYLCLGNHDMLHPHAEEMWLEYGERFFPEGKLNYTLSFEEVVLHVMPTYWGEKPYFWDGHQPRPEFHRDQEQYLRAALSTDQQKPHVLCTHSEIAAVPIDQTGFKQPYHAPTSSFTDTVAVWVQAYPNIRCVLSGHNHINTCVRFWQSGTYAVTSSAFSETPFEFKVLEITKRHMKMHTESLLQLCRLDADYDFNKVFVQGRLKDRIFGLVW
jgi:DNA repair exonuclease SbcCD nuclease subunit